MSSGTNNIQKTINAIEIKNKEDLGLISNWNGYYGKILYDEIFYDEKNTIQFPYLLFDAFSENEIKNLLRKIIEDYSEKDLKFQKGKRSYLMDLER